MAQFDILELVFPLPPSSEDPAELTVVIDNPQGMLLDEVQQGVVPADVEVVQPGGTPTQEFYVFSDHHHLTITLAQGTVGPNPLRVTDTNFFNNGENGAFLDIVVAEKEASGEKKTKRTKRRAMYIYN